MPTAISAADIAEVLQARAIDPNHQLVLTYDQNCVSGAQLRSFAEAWSRENKRPVYLIGYDGFSNKSPIQFYEVTDAHRT